jgi:NAD(P)H-hydrate epimerase
MQLVITPEESGRLDLAASEPVENLMERAGLAVALAAIDMGAGYGARVTVLAGTGNNGGDGYVAAKYLAGRGCAVTVHALGPPKDDHPAAQKAAAGAAAAGARIKDLGKPEPADLVIDALFGVGFTGSLPDVAVPWTELEVPVLAVDVPSGLDAGTGEVPGEALTAERTVTFHAFKPGHLLGEGPERCGTVTVADIGLHGGKAAMLVCDAVDAARPPRPRTSHKWSAGSVAVVGGSPGITGAPMLAARGALAMGAGSAAVVCPRALQPTYAAISDEVMTRGVGSGSRFTGDDVDAVIEQARRFDVMVLGPGLGLGQDRFVEGLLSDWDGPMVVDADALNALQGTEVLSARNAPTVITPHAGEFRRLTGQDADYRVAAMLPEELGVVVLLKGNPTFVLGSQVWAVRSGGPELATIGTGDVLAGMVAALWARGLSGEAAARSGAYWHGRAAADLSEHMTVTAGLLANVVGQYAW